MRTIDDIKDQYAKEQEYESWHYMLYLCTTSASYIPELEKHINEVCHRYATECQDELKKKIVEEADIICGRKTKKECMQCYGGGCENPIIDKNSTLNTENVR